MLKIRYDDFKASVYKFDENDVFNGDVVPMWDAVSKEKAINEFTKQYNIDLENSYSYGDTTGDFSMFLKVGNPVAINPEKKLLFKIRDNEILSKKIKIILERKNVIYITNSDIEFFENW